MTASGACMRRGLALTGRTHAGTSWATSSTRAACARATASGSSASAAASSATAPCGRRCATSASRTPPGRRRRGRARVQAKGYTLTCSRRLVYPHEAPVCLGPGGPRLGREAKNWFWRALGAHQAHALPPGRKRALVCAVHVSPDLLGEVRSICGCRYPGLCGVGPHAPETIQRIALPESVVRRPWDAPGFTQRSPVVGLHLCAGGAQAALQNGIWGVWLHSVIFRLHTHDKQLAPSPGHKQRLGPQSMELGQWVFSSVAVTLEVHHAEPWHGNITEVFARLCGLVRLRPIQRSYQRSCWVACSRMVSRCRGCGGPAPVTHDSQGRQACSMRRCSRPQCGLQLPWTGRQRPEGVCLLCAQIITRTRL